MKKKETVTYSAVLCPGEIDEISERIRDFLTELKIPKREVFRYSMTAEEILLDSEEACDGLPVTLEMGRRFRRYFITLEISGRTLNVFAAQEEEQGVFGGGILKNVGLSPEYSYVNDRNIYSFTVMKKQANPLIILGIAVGLALVIGALGYFIPDAARDALLNNVLVPLNDTFFDLLGALAGPMMFLSVAWGIYGIGDAATLKKIGRKLCLGYVGIHIAAGLLTGALAVPLFDLHFAKTGSGASAAASLFTMLLGIVPKDIFSPFVDGNTLQIIALAIVFGIAMLFLGQKTDFIAKVVEQINYIVMFLIEAIGKLVPCLVFFMLLKIIWSGMLSSLAGIGKVAAIFIGAAVLFHIGLVCFTGLRNKVDPRLIVKKQMPTMLIALATASSAAAFGTNVKCCREGLGIDEKICSFGVPLGMVMNKPTSMYAYIALALYFAEYYTMDISGSWLIILLVTSVILAIATPPVSGGGLVTYAVLFTQLGIPQEALAIALAFDTVFDFVMTSANLGALQLVLLNQAGRLGLVARDKLTANK